MICFVDKQSHAYHCINFNPLYYINHTQTPMQCYNKMLRQNQKCRNMSSLLWCLFLHMTDVVSTNSYVICKLNYVHDRNKITWTCDNRNKMWCLAKLSRVYYQHFIVPCNIIQVLICTKLLNEITSCVFCEIKNSAWYLHDS